MLLGQSVKFHGQDLLTVAEALRVLGHAIVLKMAGI
jgi:hypothetical protein